MSMTAAEAERWKKLLSALGTVADALDNLVESDRALFAIMLDIKSRLETLEAKNV